MSKNHCSSPYFVMDTRVVDSTQDVSLEVCPPRKTGPVLMQEKPWESFYMHPHTLIFHKGEYLLYYLVYIVNDGPYRLETCLAVSQDGIRWERPELGQVVYAGSKANNMITKGGSVAIDPQAPESGRFLMTGWGNPRPGDPGGIKEGVVLFTSADGRTWTQASPPLSPFMHDTNNQVFFDEHKGRYVAYLRAMTRGRSVAYYEPPDAFHPWPIQPGPNNKGVAHTTPFDPPGFVPERVYYVTDELPIAIEGAGGIDAYNPAVFYMKGMYLALPDIFRAFPGPKEGSKERFPDSEYWAWWNDGYVAPRLYASEDGVSFRPIGGAPYIDLGSGDDWDIAQIRMVTGLIENGDEVWQYYGGQRTGHTLARGRRPRKGSAVMRAVQRRDGFAAFVAGPDGSQVVTKPLTCSGEELEVNFDAGAWGEVRVELLDPQGQPVPGYTLDDSAPLIGNVIYDRVLWAYRRDLKDWVGKEIRLRFRLRKARLFSFRFAGKGG